MKRFCLLLVLSLGVATSVLAREIYSLNSGWKFFYMEENSSDNAREITLPHTWNIDAFVGNGTYRQTSASYQRTLFVPAEWKGKRLFLRFNGVQSIADVFINGRHIGDHYGGYTAFAFEITDNVSYGFNNSLFVAVSNTYRNDVLPTSVEENVYGGIYRDVELIVTDKTTISPLYYGTDGVMIHQTEVSKERVSGRVEVALLGRKDSQHNVTIDFYAPDGYVSLSKTVKAKIDGNLLSVPFTIDNAELWSLGSPRLYTVKVTVEDESVEVKTGFRKIEVTSDKKFTINGRRVRVHGVLLGHDRMPKGNAVSEVELEADLALVREMGANAVRSVTGPHAQSLYDEMDRMGMVAWIDFPFARAPFLSDIPYYSTPRFEANGLQQLHEIVLQNINHPSVAMWGVFSMLRGNSKQQMDYIRKLNSTAKKLDASRPTVAISNQDGDINFITDLIVFRQNVGWSKGHPDDVSVWCRQLASNKLWGQLHFGVCYGEEGVRNHFSERIERSTRGERRLPERRQSYLHERYLANISESGIFWGVWLETMFDYASSRRAYGINHSGVVDYDHREAKDAYYLYRALWNEESPTLHITNKAWRDRRDTLQYIDVYCSEGATPLLLRGEDTLSMRRVAPAQWRADSVVVRGDVEVRAVDECRALCDSIRFRVSSYVIR